MKSAVAAIAVATLPGLAFAQPLAGPSDFYIRAEGLDGAFHGYHAILAEPFDGYHEASFCDRTFWVTATTVAWTETQMSAGNQLFVEVNAGKSRKVVCTDTASFPTLKKLGIGRDEVYAEAGGGRRPMSTGSRLKQISERFR